MSVQTSTAGDVLVLIVATLDGMERAALRNLVQEQIENGLRKTVLDLSRVDLIGSTGIGSIVACHVAMTREGGELCLAGAGEKISRCLRITGLDNVFKTFATKQEALRYFEHQQN